MFTYLFFIGDNLLRSTPIYIIFESSLVRGLFTIDNEYNTII